MDSSWTDKLPFKKQAERVSAILDSDKVRRMLQLVFQITVAVIFGVLVALLMFRTVTMQENSMEPTIEVGDRFFINRVVYRVGDPERGDIIAFKTNGSDDAALHISRVIGLPGESVRIANGRIYIDEEVYSDNVSLPAIKNPGLAATTVNLNSGEYFVLGDNRNNSEDSRYSDIGKVSKKYIVGKLWFRVFPKERMGFI